MNYLELLDKELKETDWDLEHKRRYLYLRSCQLFTYDTRMNFVNPVNALTTNTFIMEAKAANAIYEELRSKEIDLENVEDRRVTCFSGAKAYTTLVNELLGLNAFCAKNKIHTHAWSIMDGHMADVTEKSDLTRVKMNLSTYGYNLSISDCLYIPDKDSAEKIKMIDQDISYIGEEYVSFKKIFLQYKMQLLSSKKTFFLFKQKRLEEMYNWWITKVIEVYRSYQGILTDFDDASFCLSYLFEYLNKFSDLEFKAVSAILFLDSDREDWDFVEVYRVSYNKTEYWYLLSKADVGYDFQEISPKEAQYYLSNYKGDKYLILQKKL